MKRPNFERLARVNKQRHSKRIFYHSSSPPYDMLIIFARYLFIYKHKNYCNARALASVSVFISSHGIVLIRLTVAAKAWL